MKKRKSKIRQNKSYNKKSKFRRKKSKKKIIGGSIYDTQEDQNVELSKENERLKIQLAEADADWTSRLQRYADKLKICEEENKRLRLKEDILSKTIEKKRQQDEFIKQKQKLKNQLQEQQNMHHHKVRESLEKRIFELQMSNESLRRAQLRPLQARLSLHSTEAQGERTGTPPPPHPHAETTLEYHQRELDRMGTSPPPLPHAETTLEYHQRELDRMGTSPTIVSPSTDFSKGDRVYYNNQEEAQLATILRIDRNVPLGEDPYVTLKIDGHEGERQTTIDRIRKVD